MSRVPKVLCEIVLVEAREPNCKGPIAVLGAASQLVIYRRKGGRGFSI